MELLAFTVLYLFVGFVVLFITALIDIDRAEQYAPPIVCAWWMVVIIWLAVKGAEFTINAAKRVRRNK